MNNRFDIWPVFYYQLVILWQAQRSNLLHKQAKRTAILLFSILSEKKKKKKSPLVLEAILWCA
jgi:hypothetical protein